MTASRSTRAALPTCDTCGASGSNRRAREADADHVEVKTEMLQLRLMEKKRELVRRDAHEAMIDQMAGLVLTKLGGWPARVAGADLGVRRRAEAVLPNCAPR